MNQIEYDLSADPKLADAAEAARRGKALAEESERKQKEKEKAAAEPKAAEPDLPKDENASRATAAANERVKKEKIPVPPQKKAAIEDFPEELEETENAEEKADREKTGPLDPDLYEALADPLRATRKRSLPPGKYTIEVQSGGAKETTTLIVKPEKEGAGESEELEETR